MEPLAGSSPRSSVAPRRCWWTRARRSRPTRAQPSRPDQRRQDRNSPALLRRRRQDRRSRQQTPADPSKPGRPPRAPPGHKDRLTGSNAPPHSSVAPRRCSRTRAPRSRQNRLRRALSPRRSRPAPRPRFSCRAPTPPCSSRRPPTRLRWRPDSPRRPSSERRHLRRLRTPPGALPRALPLRRPRRSRRSSTPELPRHPRHRPPPARAARSGHRPDCPAASPDPALRSLRPPAALQAACPDHRRCSPTRLRRPVVRLSEPLTDRPRVRCCRRRARRRRMIPGVSIQTPRPSTAHRRTGALRRPPEGHVRPVPEELPARCVPSRSPNRADSSCSRPPVSKRRPRSSSPPRARPITVRRAPERADRAPRSLLPAHMVAGTPRKRVRPRVSVRGKRPPIASPPLPLNRPLRHLPLRSKREARRFRNVRSSRCCARSRSRAPKPGACCGRSSSSSTRSVGLIA